MKLVLIIPQLLRKYVANFPEVRNNAYKYFNYDNRVVDERVSRGDALCTYKGPDDFTDMDYDFLMRSARNMIDPVLAKYSMDVACEDALSMAIRSIRNGSYDGKINAGRYNVILKALKDSFAAPRFGKTEKREVPKPKKPVKKEAPRQIKHRELRQLGLQEKSIPHTVQVKKQKGVPQLVKEKGKVILQK